MYTYSIIIPHKNTPKLLQRCLDSIPKRNDLHVIVVDDNSDPGKVDFDHFPGYDRDDVELIFTKEGKGAGYARNVGMKHICGKWVLFADSDDYFYPDAFNELDNYCDSDFDIIYFYCNSRDGDTNEIIPDRVPDIRQGIEEKNYNQLRYRSFVPWGKLINKDLITKYNLAFEEIIASNDIWFSTMAGFYAKKIATISKPLYCATRNSGSLAFSPDINKIKSRVKAASKINNFLYQQGLQQYRQLGTKWIFYFFPKYPLLFIWAIFKLRYKGDTILYLRVLKRGLIKRMRELKG